MKELTLRSVLLGLILGVILSGANAYLGLKAGMTVAASIPASVISMLILTKLIKNGTILENNIVQTMASVAQAVAAGIIFTIPSFFILNETGIISKIPSFYQILIISFIGSIWGTVFMIFFRYPHIVKEHEKLPYPEGTACAEVLKTGQQATHKALYLLYGFIISASLKILQNIKFYFFSKINKILDENFTLSLYNLKNLPTALKSIVLSIDLLPALFGVGMIVGRNIAIMMATGALIAWWVIIPVISIFNPDLAPNLIYKQHIRYIGIGVIITGAFLSIIQFIPFIFKTFIKEDNNKELKYTKDPHRDLWYDNLEYSKDLNPIIAIFLIILTSIIFFIVNPIDSILGKILSYVVVIIFAFLFTAVSSYIVGLVGSSNQPVSAMTISTLIALALTLKLIGVSGENGIYVVIFLSVMACISLAIAGDMSQDLKTGFLVKATPYKQQIAGIISATFASFFLTYLIFLFNKTYGFSAIHANPLPAPQANLIATLANSIFLGDIKWNEIVVGIFLGVIARMLNFSVLAFGVGVYLPQSLSIPILLGGIFSNFIKDILNKKADNKESNLENEEKVNLVASGLIAGDTILGLLIVFLIAFNVLPSEDGESIFQSFSPFLSLLAFSLVLLLVYHILVKKR
jgi:putative OPT family oligopeptide transporter